MCLAARLCLLLGLLRPRLARCSPQLIAGIFPALGDVIGVGRTAHGARELAVFERRRRVADAANKALECKGQDLTLAAREVALEVLGDQPVRTAVEVRRLHGPETPRRYRG